MPLTIQEPITGREQNSDHSSPLAALSQFYRALNARDLSEMQQNWDATDDIVMDNPLGGIRRGWQEIRSIYERLFSSPGEYRFEFYDYTLQQYRDVFIAIGRERGELKNDRTNLKLAIRTTRVFRRTDNQWRQVHHHGSIEDPESLAQYQAAVLKQAA